MSRRPNRGMRYGPVRIASATWVEVASHRGGAAAPVATPPAPLTAWQPAQLEANSSWPLLSDTPSGWTLGIGGPPNEPTYATRAAIWRSVYRGLERSGSSPG